MSFRNIIGQEGAIRILQSAIRNNRLSHAYLFVGPDGVGKRLTAKTLVKALNCQSPTFAKVGDDSCDECRNCIRINLSEYPDVKIVEPVGNSIKIEEMRKIRREASFKPLEGRKKVYIILEASAMTQPAANSLLKTLEEPQGEMLFILTTSNIHGLLPTIISRCQLVRFKPLSTKVIAGLLIKKEGITKDEAYMASNLSEGSLGKALRIANSEKKELRNRVIDLIAKTFLKDMEEIFQTAREFTQDRDQIPFILSILSSWYRDLLVFKESEGFASLVNIDKKEGIAKEVEKYSKEEIEEVLSLILRTIDYIKRNVNPQLAIETLLLKIGEIND
ncbi:MAG TPA: DNA polymerase III subunit delta' [bacterium]|nr:DNA polymerase III subunit delta' [bacterium]